MKSIHFAWLLAAGLAFGAGVASAAAPNLVVNGDFEGGNVNFTSSYNFTSYTPGGNTTEGQYTVSVNPYPWNSSFISAGDHTSGSGLMFVGNGSPTDGAIVWQSSLIAVSTATDYFFEAWVMNVCCTSAYTGANSASILEFSINDVSVGTKTTNLANAGTWEGLSTSWNSGGATTATLKLINRNTAAGGNDFAIDDISLSIESTVTPIPEPEIYAMMGMGLGLLGWVGRRRKQQAA